MSYKITLEEFDNDISNYIERLKNDLKNITFDAEKSIRFVVSNELDCKKLFAYNKQKGRKNQISELFQCLTGETPNTSTFKFHHRRNTTAKLRFCIVGRVNQNPLPIRHFLHHQMPLKLFNKPLL